MMKNDSMEKDLEKKAKISKFEEIERRYKNIIEGSNLGTWELNAQTGEETINERWAEMLGYSIKELSPISDRIWIENIHPDDQVRVQKETKQLFENIKEQYDIEFRMKHKDGHWVWINGRGRCNSWTPEGKPLMTSGTHTDITERKQLEAAFFKNQNLLKQTEIAGKIGGFQFNTQTLEQTWTDETFRILEIDKSQGEPKVPEGVDFIASPYRASALEAIDKAVKNGEPYDQVWEVITARGNRRWVNSKGNPVQEDGIVKYIQGLIQDITEQMEAEKMLLQSEEKFRMLFDKAPLGYQSLDIDGCFIDVNQQWLAMLGYTREEVIGKWFGDFLSPVYQNGFRERFPLFKEQGYIHSEFEMVHKNGAKLFIAFDGKIGYCKDGEFKQTHCILKDITLQRQLESELAKNRELMKSLLDNTTDAIYIKDIAGKYLLFNQSAEEFVGKSANDVLNKDDTSLFPHHEAMAVMAGDQNVLKARKTKTFEETVTDPSGNVLSFLSTKGPIFNKEKELIGLFGIARDITDRKKLETELDNEKKLLKATLRSVGDGVISCDKNGHVLFLNPVAEGLTGWALEQARGKPIEQVFNIFNEATGEKSQNIAEKVIQSGIIQELENHTVLISTNGRKCPIEDSAAPIILDNGENAGAVIVFKDISEKLEKIEEIRYLSYHDYLTGLYNRRFFEEELIRYNTLRNLPMTIVMADVNGLKLINDSFGHDVGDDLLRKAAKAISEGCRADDIVARLGGDEFVIILPKTDSLEAEKLVDRVQSKLSEYSVGNIGLSISFGYETKTEETQDIREILKRAEDHMYRHKLYESASMRSQTINLIMNTLYEKNIREMNHSKRVGDLCESLAKRLDYSWDSINQIKIAGLMHDIGKIGISDNVLNKPAKLDEHEWEEIKKHSEIGYRILSSVNEFSEVAEYVLQHQEKWDGTGYPKGLKEEEISMQGRIIAIADAFDAMTGERTYGKLLSEMEAAHEIKKCAGTHFDPEIARVFVEKVLELSW